MKEILAEIKGLENRLRCYHEGKYGRSTVKMHVELKYIERIKGLIEQRQEQRPFNTLVSVPELRNKLTPITNLIALIESRKIYVTGDNDVLALFFNEIEKAKNNIKELVH